MAQVIYIAGYGRSGSTLLDMLLGSHPDISGGGELFRAAEIFADPSARCTCGVTFDACEIWADHRRLLLDRAGRGGLNGLRNRLLAMEGRKGLKPAVDASACDHVDWPVWRDIADDALRATRAAKPGASWVVDSSKTARGAAARPLLLTKAGHDVRVILLRRRLPGVLSSIRRGGNRAIEAGQSGQAPWRTAAAGGGWMLAEAANDTSRRHLPRHACKDLDFERLRAAPDVVLREIAAWLDLAPDGFDEAVRGGVTAAHMIGGNRNRFSSQTLRPEPQGRADIATLLAGLAGRGVSRLGNPI